MSSWNEHVSAALLGTGRRPPPEPPEGLLAPGQGEDPAGRLLDQAAVLAVRNRAGRRPLRGGEPIAPAPQERAVPVPAAAARRLARILGGERIRMLPEWLDAAAWSSSRPAGSSPCPGAERPSGGSGGGLRPVPSSAALTCSLHELTG